MTTTNPAAQAPLMLEVRVANSPELPGQQAAEATRLLQRGDLAGARDIYQQVLAEMPRHPSTWSNLAALAVGLGDAEAARSHALRAFSLDPHHVDAGVNFGVACWHANKRRDAERAFRHALVLAPGLETPALNLAQMWQGIGRHDLTTEMLDVALAHSPGSSRLHQARAEVARLAGDPGTARTHALAALSALLPALSPQHAMASPPPDAAAVEDERQRMRATLAATCDRLDAAGIDHHIIGGVVLGIVREGEPFHGDKDIDLVLPDSVDRDQLATLFDVGYSPFRVPKLSNAHRWCMAWIDEATGIGVDMFFVKEAPRDGVRINMGWPDHVYFAYPPYDIGHIAWRGREWPVPVPLDAYLASNYGEDWRLPIRQVGDRGFDKRWFDTQISSPSLERDSVLMAVNLGLLRLLGALRQGRWEKALALSDQLLARELLSAVEDVRAKLLVAGIG